VVDCQKSGGTRDTDLAGLVIPVTPPGVRIEVERAGRDSVELARALMQLWSATTSTIGEHTLTIEHTVEVREGATVLETLGETTTLAVAPDGTYHATYQNTADYGREVIYLATTNTLYLRPRYARWHRRDPESLDEPTAIRDQFASVLGADFELISRSALVTDQGATTEAGRSARRLAIARSPTARKVPVEKVAQRTWRNDLSVDALAGEIVLDQQTGAPLRAKLSATVAFLRDDKRLTMQLGVSHRIAIAPTPTIIAPPDDVVVNTPERRREVDDRNFLLQGIAPPVGKGAAVTTPPATSPP
jgi:hypothetical protein